MIKKINKDKKSNTKIKESTTCSQCECSCKTQNTDKDCFPDIVEIAKSVSDTFNIPIGNIDFINVLTGEVINFNKENHLNSPKQLASDTPDDILQRILNIFKYEDNDICNYPDLDDFLKGIEILCICVSKTQDNIKLDLEDIKPFTANVLSFLELNELADVKFVSE